MGGAAFAAGAETLHTPRMPAHVYNAIKAQCHSHLGQLYVHVATPVEGPEKLDFGDVDILVSKPRAEPVSLNTKPNAETQPTQNLEDAGNISCQDTPDDPHALKKAILTYIKDALDARAMKYDSSVRLSGHFAVPWPKVNEHESRAAFEGQEQMEHDQRFIQVDVYVCETVEEFEWMLFKHSHGDLVSLFLF